MPGEEPPEPALAASSLDFLDDAEEALHDFIRSTPTSADRAKAAQALKIVLDLKAAQPEVDAQAGDMKSLSASVVRSADGRARPPTTPERERRTRSKLVVNAVEDCERRYHDAFVEKVERRYAPTAALVEPTRTTPATAGRGGLALEHHRALRAAHLRGNDRDDAGAEAALRRQAPAHARRAARGGASPDQRGAGARGHARATRSTATTSPRSSATSCSRT